MSFPVQLMLNSDPYNKIQKSPTVVAAVNGTLKEECSLMDPEILIERSEPIIDANYAYIEFSENVGKYYFIKNVEAYRSGLWRVSMHCDVLMTYADGILSSPVIVARSSTRVFCSSFETLIFTKAFPNGFDTSTASYVLALIGQADTGG